VQHDPIAPSVCAEKRDPSFSIHGARLSLGRHPPSPEPAPAAGTVVLDDLAERRRVARLVDLVAATDEI
jgi:hypothetical protein